MNDESTSLDDLLDNSEYGALENHKYDISGSERTSVAESRDFNHAAEVYGKMDIVDGSTRYSAGRLGYFDLEKFKFVKDVPIISGNELRAVLAVATIIGATDVFLQEDEYIWIKKAGRTVPVTERRLHAQELKDAIGMLIDNLSLVQKVVSGGEDSSQPFSLSVHGYNNIEKKPEPFRFRGNGTFTAGRSGARSGFSFTYRAIHRFAPTMDHLKVPDYLRENVFPKQGLVIVSGPTGSGKTSLLASFIRHVTTNGSREVFISYEDPMEYDFRETPDLTSLVAQTNIRDALGTFGKGTEDAMRRSANCILVGEIRDKASFEGALSLAGTGHRVYSTTHAGSPEMTISRLMDFVHASEKADRLAVIVASIEIVISQRLVRTKAGGVIPVQGWLKFSREVRDEIVGSGYANYVTTVKRLTEKFGRSMLADLESKRDVIDEEEFAKLAMEYK